MSVNESRKRERVPFKHYWEKDKKIRKGRYVVFDFFNERPKSLLTVPETWIKDSGTCCLWPPQNSSEQSKLASLIRDYSQPNPEWLKLPGKVKKYVDSFREAEEYLQSKRITSDSEFERITHVANAINSNENLDIHDERKSSAINLQEDNNMEIMANLRQLSEVVLALDQKLDSVMQLITECNSKVRHRSVETMTPDDAQDTLNEFKLPLKTLDHFPEFEEILTQKTNRQKVRTALRVLAPRSPSNSNVNPVPVHGARSICRSIAPDEIFQFFTRELSSRSKVEKRSLTETFPNVTKIIVSVIMTSCNIDVERALSALGKHLSKCGDRKKSKCFLSTTDSQLLSTSDENVPNDDVSVTSGSSHSTLTVSSD